jgi:hypothetical protein
MVVLYGPSLDRISIFFDDRNSLSWPPSPDQSRSRAARQNGPVKNLAASELPPLSSCQPFFLEVASLQGRGQILAQSIIREMTQNGSCG